jgi:hypothetical protein
MMDVRKASHHITVDIDEIKIAYATRCSIMAYTLGSGSGITFISVDEDFFDSAFIISGATRNFLRQLDLIVAGFFAS